MNPQTKQKIGFIRPDAEGYWWALKNGKWSIGKAKIEAWPTHEDDELTLTLNSGGRLRRCDTINLNIDEGVRYFPTGLALLENVGISHREADER